MIDDGYGNPAPITCVDKILAYNDASDRDKQIEVFLKSVKNKTRPIILIVDFNEPSHLDWTINTSDKFEHNGVVIDWQNTKTLSNNGFTDSFREIYLDEELNPGFTMSIRSQSYYGNTSILNKKNKLNITKKMKKYHLLIVFIVLTIFNVNAAFKGRVFEDTNADGIYNTGEKGMKGVFVSDGLNVVETDKDGNFELKGSTISKFVYITIPAGYKSSKDFYLKIEPGKETYDFGLLEFSTTKNNTRFIQITDTETYEYGDWVDNLRDYSTNNEVGFLVHTGDICYEKGLKFHAKNINSKTMELPVFYCIGNHDLVKGDYGEQLFESLFGPVYYSFDAGNTHFIVTPMRSGDYKPSYTNSQVYDWLANDLAHVDPSKNVVIFNHDLLTFDDQFVFKAKGKKDINLNEHNLKAWIYGHWHINFLKQHGQNGPISVCSSTPDKGGIDHSPSNFLVYDISNKGKVEITPRYSYVKKHIVINSPIGNDIIWNQFENLEVSVNTYHSVSKTNQVTGNLINKKGEQESFRLFQNTDWSWSTEVPLNKKWKNGELKLIVESTFENGEKVIQEKSYGILSGNLNSNILKAQWATNVKGNIWMAAPIEANGKVFVATIDDFGMENCGIHAMDAISGLKLWDYRTKGSVKNTICHEDGKVLATDHFGISYALDAATGELIWKKNLGQKALGAYNSGSVVKEGVFYTGFGNYLQAINVKTGKTIWVNKDWRGGEGATSTMIIADDILIAGSNWRALYAHDIETGKLLWEKSEEGYRFRSSSATYLNNILYVASLKGIGMMDAHTGEMHEYFETPYNLQASTKPLLVNNMIIMGTSKEGLVAFDRKNGEEIWHIKTGESLFYTAPYSKFSTATVESPPVLINGFVIFGASDGFLYVVNPKDGIINQKINLGAPVFSSVTSYLNGFFVADFGGNIYSFLMR